jgi:hypothetical protein
MSYAGSVRSAARLVEMLGAPTGPPVLLGNV